MTGERKHFQHGAAIWRSRHLSNYKIVAIYLVAIVAANIIAARFGPGATVVNAFLFVGLDLTARDRLHDAWKGRQLFPKMAALIAAGAVLSWLLAPRAGTIAAASFVAFAVAGAVDTIAYHVMRNYPRSRRVNASNALSAAADSVIFPALAFGGFFPVVIAGQWIAKVFGGALWLAILDKRIKR